MLPCAPCCACRMSHWHCLSLCLSLRNAGFRCCSVVECVAAASARDICCTYVSICVWVAGGWLCTVNSSWRLYVDCRWCCICACNVTHSTETPPLHPQTNCHRRTFYYSTCHYGRTNQPTHTQTKTHLPRTSTRSHALAIHHARRPKAAILQTVYHHVCFVIKRIGDCQLISICMRMQIYNRFRYKIGRNWKWKHIIFHLMKVVLIWGKYTFAKILSGFWERIFTSYPTLFHQFSTISIDWNAEHISTLAWRNVDAICEPTTKYSGMRYRDA